jgi:hypothetical protein
MCCVLCVAYGYVLGTLFYLLVVCAVCCVQCYLLCTVCTVYCHLRAL